MNPPSRPGATRAPVEWDDQPDSSPTAAVDEAGIERARSFRELFEQWKGEPDDFTEEEWKEFEENLVRSRTRLPEGLSR